MSSPPNENGSDVIDRHDFLPRSPAALFPLLTLFVPGLPQFWVKRPFRGIFWLAAFGAGIYVTYHAWPQDPRMVWYGLGGTALSYFGAWIDLLCITRRIDRERADRLLREGVLQLLREEYDEADRTFREMLAIDRKDPDGWLYLAMTQKYLGNGRKAKSLFAKCRRQDKKGKWKAELSTLLPS